MSKRLVTHLLDRALPAGCPEEDFFLAGPAPAARQASHTRRSSALLADLRRQRAARPPLAA